MLALGRKVRPSEPTVTNFVTQQFAQHLANVGRARQLERAREEAGVHRFADATDGDDFPEQKIPELESRPTDPLGWAS